jgi:hypothetical protein
MDLVYVVEGLGPAYEHQSAGSAEELQKIANAAALGRPEFIENAVEFHFPNGVPPESRAAVESALIQVVGGNWERSYRVHPPRFQIGT